MTDATRKHPNANCSHPMNQLRPDDPAGSVCGVCGQSLNVRLPDEFYSAAPSPSTRETPPPVCTGSGHPGASIYFSASGRGRCGICGQEVNVGPDCLAETHPYRAALPSRAEVERAAKTFAKAVRESALCRSELGGPPCFRNHAKVEDAAFAALLALFQEVKP